MLDLSSDFVDITISFPSEKENGSITLLIILFHSLIKELNIRPNLVNQSFYLKMQKYTL